MDGVSSIFAVLSLSFQLLDIVQKTSGFVKDIQDAPNELIELSETLSQLLLVLEEVHLLLQQRRMVPCLPGSPKYLLRALEGCEKKIKPLQAIVQKANGTIGQGNRAQRTWASFKLVVKKERLRDLQTQLRDAKMDLIAAISVNQSHLQMYHLQITIDASRNIRKSVNGVQLSNTDAGSSFNQVTKTRPTGPAQSAPPAVQKRAMCWYQGIHGTVGIATTTKRSTLLTSSGPHDQNVVLKETSIMIAPKFIQSIFRLLITNHYGQISRSLSVYPVVSWKSSCFQMCRDGDKHGLEVAFSDSGLSPLVVDENGETLLHHAAQAALPKLCSWLLRLGLDPNRRSSSGRKAVENLALSSNCVANGRVRSVEGQRLDAEVMVETLQILGKAQDEFSAADVEDIWCLYGGPYDGSPQGAELLYQKSLALTEFQDDDTKLTSGYALALAIREYGRGIREWEYFIRKLIRTGVDLDGRTSQGDIGEPAGCCGLMGHESEIFEEGGNEHPLAGTPLDELFKMTVSVYGAESCAKRWLNILRSEGFDVVAYLEKEFELHATQQQLTYSGGFGTTRRQLVFSFGENPTVWWEWLLDPESGAYLVREKFKAMDTFWDDHEDLGSIADPQVDVSPFDYPDWSFERMPPAERAEDIPNDYIYRRLNAQARLNRRWKKKASKLARARRTKGPRKIPGAWPT